MRNRRVVVVGGGIAGSASALALARRGHDVVLLERSPRLGGLLVSFEVAGTPIECFYHHVFPHEHHVQSLISELGLGPDLQWFPSSVGVFTGGRVWPFTSPLDLLRFGSIPLRDRLHTGIGALRMGRVSNWEQLDSVTARDWLTSYTGRRATEVVWEPLLRAKFGPAAGGVPAAWMWGRFQQRAGSRTKGGERLAYLRGGFRRVFDALEGELTRLGADVRVQTVADRVAMDAGRVTGVDTTAGPIEADAVLFAGQLPALARLLPVGDLDPRWSAIGGLGVLCVLVELTRAVTDVFWTNVCDPEVPFGGHIEHTNLVPTADYGGRHVVYLSRYFTADEPLAGADPGTEAERWVDALVDRFPGARRRDILAVHPFRADYAAPLVQVGHLGRIPPLRSHIAGLYVCTTAQIYPQDRGMNEGVRTGFEAADAIAEDAALAATPR